MLGMQLLCIDPPRSGQIPAAPFHPLPLTRAILLPPSSSLGIPPVSYFSWKRAGRDLPDLPFSPRWTASPRPLSMPLPLSHPHQAPPLPLTLPGPRMPPCGDRAHRHVHGHVGYPTYFLRLVLHANPSRKACHHTVGPHCDEPWTSPTHRLACPALSCRRTGGRHVTPRSYHSTPPTPTRVQTLLHSWTHRSNAPPDQSCMAAHPLLFAMDSAHRAAHGEL
jgi:hypothetical protein